MTTPRTEAGRVLRRWVFNEMGITGEGAWTEEFDRRLAAIEAEAAALAIGEHAQDPEGHHGRPYREVIEKPWREALRELLNEYGKFAASDFKHVGFFYNALDKARALLNATPPASSDD